jgi:metal-responsive CopG/Arc/MetJ family transcriptional regulator
MKLDDLVKARDKNRSEVVRDLIRNSHKSLRLDAK